MSFQKENIESFLEIFQEVKPKIQEFPGCQKVELKQDADHQNVLYTHSIWNSENALEKYRESEFFKSTWAKTKVLFDQKPRAYSLVEPQGPTKV